MDGNTLAVIAFWVLAALAIFSALAVVLLKNIVHSTLFLALSFVSIAGIYLTLNADFLAAVQVLVYAGAVAIMIVFGVMLTNRGDIRESSLFYKRKVVSVLTAFSMFVMISFIILKSNWFSAVEAVPEKTAENIAQLLFTKYVIPFEVTALLLLVAMIGAIIIAKEVKAHD